MSVIASQITSLAIVYSTVYSGADQRKHQRSASLAFVRGVHRGPVNSPHKWPVTRKMFPFDEVIISTGSRPGHFNYRKGTNFGPKTCICYCNVHLQFKIGKNGYCKVFSVFTQQCASTGQKPFWYWYQYFQVSYASDIREWSGLALVHCDMVETPHYEFKILMKYNFFGSFDWYIFIVIDMA